MLFGFLNGKYFSRANAVIATKTLDIPEKNRFIKSFWFGGEGGI